ncbi:glycosyltransferase [Dactylosporangium sp. NPDC006015]|uniref:glycosyltransferase family 2 protein n=1 Tax=Dactylosporangium sp. NPDC006015 TaxID=3154576 RepID=UPI0033AF2072
MTSLRTPRVSIGIPAYNEAANIGRLVRGLLAQDETGYELVEIVVASDGSSDDTAAIVQGFSDQRVKLRDSRERLGKTTRMNQLLSDFDGDILILLDADVAVGAPDFVSCAARDFRPKYGVMAVNAVPLAGRTLVEKCVVAGSSAVEQAAAHWDGGSNYLAFRGACLVLGQEFARRLELPASLVSNDAYVYFCARQLGYTPKYAREIRVRFRVPATIRDHLRQSERFQHSSAELARALADLSIPTSYRVPRGILVRAFLTQLRRRPLALVGYVVLTVHTRVHIGRKPDVTWDIATSTKELGIASCTTEQ